MHIGAPANTELCYSCQRCTQSSSLYTMRAIMARGVSKVLKEAPGMGGVGTGFAP